jgi:hypothetical protein
MFTLVMNPSGQLPKSLFLAFLGFWYDTMAILFVEGLQFFKHFIPFPLVSFQSTLKAKPNILQLLSLLRGQLSLEHANLKRDPRWKKEAHRISVKALSVELDRPDVVVK